MRTWTTWDWIRNPEEPLSWPDPEKRIVLCAPPLLATDCHKTAALFHMLAGQGEDRGVVMVMPAEAGPASFQRGVDYGRIIPALVVRRQADLAGVGALFKVQAERRAYLVEPGEPLTLPLGGCAACKWTGYDNAADIPGVCICEIINRGPDFGDIDLVIVRGRDNPVHPDVVRSLRDQCKAAGVAFFFAGWGAYLPDDHAPREIIGFSRRKRAWMDSGCDGPMPEKIPGDDVWWSDGTITDWGVMVDGVYQSQWAGQRDAFYRVGPERSGRMLDGREWLETPEGI